MASATLLFHTAQLMTSYIDQCEQIHTQAYKARRDFTLEIGYSVAMYILTAIDIDK